MMNLYKVDFPSPIGVIEIAGTKDTVYSVLFADREIVEYARTSNTPQAIEICYQQLEEYFAGKRLEFTFPYEVSGTAFQREVWQALTTIPYAKTASYRDIARTIGREKAVRAVGSANGKNKISIAIPCHRIIGANGKLTGYAGGLWRKEWLLEHEQRISSSEKMDLLS
ncbi:methylated-DNA--[protein]-cysteine S-methyltransferase [Virgibacillus salarius]|nr:methylated-DNA--[protein]-cysteine S-methyltransferase [Priestia megaterium]